MMTKEEFLQKICPEGLFGDMMGAVGDIAMFGKKDDEE